MSQPGSSQDPMWLQELRARQLAHRPSLGAPGPQRWKTFHERASEYREHPELASTSAANLIRQEHEVLRQDLGQSLAYFEPQADTMIVEGRPTQVS